MGAIVDYLFTHVWWMYDPQADWYAQPYHWINLVEGTFWLSFAALVVRRSAVPRRSALELVYAFAFLVFGLSDYREAYVVESWLILHKALNLGALLWLRHVIHRRF